MSHSAKHSAMEAYKADGFVCVKVGGYSNGVLNSGHICVGAHGLFYGKDGAFKSFQDTSTGGKHT